MNIENELVKRLLERLDAEDAKAVDMMAGGLLRDFGEYRHAGGYRKAIADTKTLIIETFEDIMKE